MWTVTVQCYMVPVTLQSHSMDSHKYVIREDLKLLTKNYVIVRKLDHYFRL